MPVNEFTPDLISRYDESFVRFVNENFLAIKRVFEKVPYETISTIPPSSPYDGQKYSDPTSDIEYIWDATAGNWLAINMWGAWLPITPTILQNVTVAHTDSYCSYKKEGRHVTYQGYATLSAAGTANNVIRVGIPATASVASARAIGGGYYSNTVVNCPFIAYLDTTSSIAFIATDTSTALSLGQTGAGPNGGNATLANNHRLTWFVEYESAT